MFTKNGKAILKRTKIAMVKAMCSHKVFDRKTTGEPMYRLVLKETIDRSAAANGVRWYGHVLRWDIDNSVLRAALDLEVSSKKESKDGGRKPERSKWKRRQRKLV